MVKKEGSFLQILIALFILLILITISSGFAFAQTVILNQPPNQEDAWVSDPDYPHSLAENFILSSTATVTQIKIWGIYCCTTNTPGTDNFTVIFHSDSGGLPGGVISTQNNVPVTRQATGGSISTWTEYVYTLTLATPVNLIPGTYWVEIYNDVTGSTGQFYWEYGTVDPANGIPGCAESSSVPGSSWASSNDDNLAIEITASTSIPTNVPTMNEWGMIVFTILAGFGAVVYLRRQSRATR